MKYTLERDENIIIFTIKNDKIDSTVSAELKAQLLIECQPNIEALILDLSKVEIMDSSGISALLLANRQLKDFDIPILLVGVNDSIYSVLEISQLVDNFEFCSNIDEAYEFLNDPFDEI